MSLPKMDVRMLLLSYLREAQLHAVRMTGTGTAEDPYFVELKHPNHWFAADGCDPGSPRALLCEKIAETVIQHGVREFSRFSTPPEKPLTVADAIERLKAFPPQAEFRVTEVGADGYTSVNVPARDILFEAIGPLLYVEVV